ncbi:hypothetical protein TruAng_007128 [Truncatella angustata]|nr:hypothetical protein TruAng_007128 [Truncatella angustata]
MALVIGSQPPKPSSRSSSVKLRRRSSWAALLHPRTALRTSRTTPDLSRPDVELASIVNVEGEGELDKFAELGLTLGAGEEEYLDRIEEFPRLLSGEDDHGIDGDKDLPRTFKPFQKWMKTLQHRAQQRRRSQNSIDDLGAFPTLADDRSLCHSHRRSSSGSSFAYVLGVRSASISLAESAFTRSRRNTAISSHHVKTDRGSRASMSAERRSEDSVRSERSVFDPAVIERLLQRRRILEELIATEESYIGDIKFLMNVYVTILASLPTQHPGLRSSINRNLTDIVELHEGILGELHRAVPNSEYTQPDQFPIPLKSTGKASHHQRWHSLDSVPEDTGGASWLQYVPGITAEPDVAVQVSRIFRERMHRFFVYEEYGAKYEMMIKDVAMTSRTMPQWETYQKGLEALAASLGSVNRQLDRSRKSLTIGDLLVKPIQRICRYPLLFAELLKYTPVCDCPHAHAEIENVLARLREATSEINRATDDPSVKVTMETTWLLQDRLVFPNQSFDAALKTTIRSLGQIKLCGALHICWQTRGGVEGQYMACIGLNTIRIEEADNGRGLQCHSAPFSWKLVFEIDHQLYEIIMTACTPKEEHEWRNRLIRSIPNEAQESGEPLFCSSLFLNIKSLGTVFGKPGSVARRLSIHRAMTVGPKSPLCQVILKHTTTMKDSSNSTSGSPINRSQSLLTTTSRIPILAPPRGDRARLEAQLSDVWTRNILPFPGITARSRSEHLVRTSASTMMRKLSVASITTSFAKRSSSSASVSTVKAKDEELPQVNNSVDSLVSLNCEVSHSILDLDQSHDDIRRLPVIRDATERTSSCSPRLPSTDTNISSSTVWKMDLSRQDIENFNSTDVNEKVSFKAPVLQATSVNSVSQPFIARATTPTPPMRQKENISQVHKTKRPIQETTNPSKLSKRAKPGGKNRSMVAGAIRSFFR